MFIPQQLKTKTKNTSLKHKKQKGIVEMKIKKLIIYNKSIFINIL